MTELLWLVLVWVLSSLTLSTGIGAGVVYVPTLMFLFGFDLPDAVATSLIIQLAGVGTTALGHHRRGRTDPKLAFRLGGSAAAGVVATRAAASLIPRSGAEIAYVIVMSIVGAWLVAGRRLPIPHPAHPGATARILHTRDGSAYEFCRPGHGYGIGALAGAGTGIIGISGAEIQISALMLRCGVPASAAVGTGTAAAGLALAVAAASSVGSAVASFVYLGIPAAVAGSLTAARISHRFLPEGLRVGVGLLGLLSAVGVAIDLVNGT